MRIDDLQRALENTDVEKIKAISHAIKGIAGNLGGLELQQKAAELEYTAKTQHTDRFSVLTADLLLANQRLTALFQQFLDASYESEQTDETV